MMFVGMLNGWLHLSMDLLMQVIRQISGQNSIKWLIGGIDLGCWEVILMLIDFQMRRHEVVSLVHR